MGYSTDTVVKVRWRYEEFECSRMGWLQEADQSTGEILILTQHSDPEGCSIVLRIPAHDVLHIQIV